MLSDDVLENVNRAIISDEQDYPAGTAIPHYSEKNRVSGITRYNHP